MILHCHCTNSTADVIHGKGKRPHVKLVKTHEHPLQEYLCEFCSFVRTESQGMRTGAKS